MANSFSPETKQEERKRKHEVDQIKNSSQYVVSSIGQRCADRRNYSPFERQRD